MQQTENPSKDNLWLFQEFRDQNAHAQHSKNRELDEVPMEQEKKSELSQREVLY